MLLLWLVCVLNTTRYNKKTANNFFWEKFFKRMRQKSIITETKTKPWLFELWEKCYTQNQALVSIWTQTWIMITQKTRHSYPFCVSFINDDNRRATTKNTRTTRKGKDKMKIYFFFGIFLLLFSILTSSLIVHCLLLGLSSWGPLNTFLYFFLPYFFFKQTTVLL